MGFAMACRLAFKQARSQLTATIAVASICAFVIAAENGQQEQNT
jgi:hypothetical protein